MSELLNLGLIYLVQADTFDLVNGLFELGGAFFLWLNVKMIRKDKIIKGVHWIPTIWFAAWGIFNIYYYPHLDQWVSFAGGILIVTVNVIWIWHIAYYSIQRRKESIK